MHANPDPRPRSPSTPDRSGHLATDLSRAAGLAIVLALGACAGDAARVDAPLKGLRDVPLLTHGGISAEGLQAEDDAWTEGRGAPGMTADVVLLDLDPDLAEQVLGARQPGAVGLVVARADADRVVDALRDEGPELQHEARLNLANHQRGYVAVLNQMAYVSAFTLEAAPGATVLDPQIDVLQEGARLSIDASWERAEGPWDLAVEFETANVARPLADVEVQFLGTSPLQVQAPFFRRVSLDAEVRLAPDEALLLVSPAPTADVRWLVTLVLPGPAAL